MPRAPLVHARGPRVPTNVELATTRFVGREAELDALTDVFGEASLISVLGPPGVGKSRLAREYAERRARDLAPRFPGGVWSIDLTHVKSREGLLAAVHAVLAGSRAEPRTRGDEVTAAIRRAEKTLLVLDEADGSVGFVGGVLEGWIRSAPEARFLLTSRERLRIGAEHVFDLGPLSLPRGGRAETPSESELLFLERARRVDRHLAWNDEQLGAVADLCIKLDGLPLAIELAAARTRVLAPSQIRDELARHTELLRSPRAGGALSDRTLTRAIEASWSTLSAAERRVLAHASVFVGGFTWEAAEAVVANDAVAEPILDLLHGLRDRSLLGVESGLDGERRFSMLVSVRLFASDTLSSDDRRAAHAAHAKYYTSAFPFAPETTVGRARLAQERDNLLAVHERAITDRRLDDALNAACRLAPLSSSLSYAWSLALIDAALEGADETSTPDPATRLAIGWALEARGTALRFLGRTRESMLELERAHRLGVAANDLGLAARALTGLGNGSTALGRWSAARSHFEAALAIHEHRPDRLLEGRARTMLASSYYAEEELELATEHLERALVVQREQRDRAFEGMSVTSLGIVDIAQGRRSSARAWLDEALAIHVETNNRHWEAVTLGYLGTLALESHASAEDLDEAMKRLHEARSRLEELGVHRAEAIVAAHWAHAAVLRGEYDDALAAYRDSLAWHRQTSPDHEGVVLAAMAAIAASRGDIASATSGFERAERVLAPFVRPSFTSTLRLYGGVIALALARRALSNGETETVVLREEEARRALSETVASGEMRSTEARIAARVLTRALAAFDDDRRTLALATDPTALVVEPSGLWFRAPGRSPPIRLHRRRALQFLLRALVERRAARPGEALGIATLLSSGWPGERVLPAAGQERVYTAIATLRRMGLRDVLVRRDDGYFLDPSVELVRSSSTVAPTPRKDDAVPRRSKER